MLCALPAQATRLEARALQADVAVLRRAYEALHPGLYRYRSKSEVDQSFDALRVQLGRDQSLQEAYLAFSVFAATIRRQGSKS